MRYDTIRRKVFKCDLCDGDPQCAKFCPQKALQFVSKDVSNTQKINSLSKKLIELQRVPAQEVVAEVKRNAGA
jgi:Fe-S-cluster-containing hydrogenase component 2